MPFSTAKGYIDKDEVLQWSAACAQALTRERALALDALRASGPRPIPGAPSSVMHKTPEEVEAFYDNALREIELSAILWLMTYCEGRLRTDLSARLDDKDFLGHHFQKYRAARATEHQIPLVSRGILDCWKDFMRQTLVSPAREACVNKLGAVKPLIDIRHWLAHGRYWDQPRAETIDVPSVNNVITRFFEALAATVENAKVRTVA